MKVKKDKGVTLVSLVVTILVIIIIASISIYSGKEVIKRAKLEDLSTNMLLIQVKAKECVEEASFKIGKKTNTEEINEIRMEVYGTEKDGAQMISASNQDIQDIKVSQQENNVFYKLTPETCSKWGLTKIENPGDYIIGFDEQQNIAEIYYIKGYNGKYSLTDIEQIEE